MTTGDTKENQEVFSKAHDVAYDEIKAMVQKQVITDHKVLPLYVLQEKYISELQKQNHPNENFCSEKLG